MHKHTRSIELGTVSSIWWESKLKDDAWFELSHLDKSLPIRRQPGKIIRDAFAATTEIEAFSVYGYDGQKNSKNKMYVGQRASQ